MLYRDSKRNSFDMSRWKDIGTCHKKLIMFYQDWVLDLSDFVLQHPGGTGALTHYRNKDITHILFTVYPHHKDSLLFLEKYIIGYIKSQSKLHSIIHTPTQNIQKPQFANIRNKAMLNKRSHQHSIANNIPLQQAENFGKNNAIKSNKYVRQTLLCEDIANLRSQSQNKFKKVVSFKLIDFQVEQSQHYTSENASLEIITINTQHQLYAQLHALFDTCTVIQDQNIKFKISLKSINPKFMKSLYK